jgi:hypothetical protein
MSWEPLVDTAEPTGRVAEAIRYEPGQIYRLQAHSFALFIDRAPRLIPPRGIPTLIGGLSLDGAGVQERDRLL